MSQSMWEEQWDEGYRDGLKAAFRALQRCFAKRANEPFHTEIFLYDLLKELPTLEALIQEGEV